MDSFFNKVLRTDLTNQSYSHEPISDEVLKRTLGGKGLGIHYLLTENPKGVDPFSPDNIFVIAVGPITGTTMWGQSRFGVCTKSPATRGYGESYCGGTVAPKIKACGVDVVIITGKAPFLQFLTVKPDEVRFCDAHSIKGKETYESEQYIFSRSEKGAGAIAIGPAGENLCAAACIKSDYWRSLGRGGLGSVLGSKNLKGITFRGLEKTETTDSVLLKHVVRSIAKKGRGSPITDVYRNYGTPSQVKVTNEQNCFPTRYWQSGHHRDWKSLSADYMQEHFTVERHGCPNCFLQCTKQSTVQEGRHSELIIEGPEYETIYAFGD